MSSQGPARGFTLVEVMSAVMLLAIGLLGLASLLVVNEQGNALAEDEARLSNAFRGVAERIRSAPFDTAAQTFDGMSFTIDEIDGECTVECFLDETDDSEEAQALGFPRDLDGDGQATNTNVLGSYVLLPVRVEAAWTPTSGDTEFREFHFMLSAEE